MTSGRPIHTDRLLVIAGPPCAGKTTLVSRIRGGSLPALSTQLALDDPIDWNYVDATDLARMRESFVDRLVVHYDLLVQRTPAGYRYLPDLIERSGRVVLLTLWTAPESLRRRSRERLVDGFAAVIRDPMRPRKNFRRLRRLWRRHRVFGDSEGVRRLYEEWFGFASLYPRVPHWVLDSTSEAPAVAETFEIAQRWMREA